MIVRLTHSRKMTLFDDSYLGFSLHVRLYIFYCKCNKKSLEELVPTTYIIEAIDSLPHFHDDKPHHLAHGAPLFLPSSRL